MLMVRITTQITIRKNKNKEKKTQNTKNHNEEINKTKHIDNKNIVSNSIHRNSTASPPKSKETVLIVGDSMVKKINGFYLTKDIKHKYLVKMRLFSSAKSISMHDHTKPTIRAINPKHIILHGCTNDVKLKKTASQIANSMTELANSLKNETNSMHVSLIVPRNDNLNNKVNELNKHLTNMSQQRNIKVISHNLFIQMLNIYSAKHLDENSLHLNRYGAIEFAKNFKNFLYKLN